MKWCESSGLAPRPGLARHGFALRELLVGCFLLANALLVGVGCVQRARINDNRTSVIYNLRQIALAMHSADGTFKRMPPATGSFGSIKFDAPISIHLLPFVEQDALYKMIAKEGNVSGKLAEAVIPAFQAALDPSVGDGRNTQSFAANIRVFTKDGFGTPLGKDVTFTSGYGAPALGRSFPDGHANVILLATRYAHNSTTFPTATVGCSPYDAPWDDSPTKGSPFFGRVTALVRAEGKATKTPTFQVAPNVPDLDCVRANFAHAYTRAGLQVALADASVRTVSPDVTVRTWNEALCPNDGAPLGSDF